MNKYTYLSTIAAITYLSNNASAVCNLRKLQDLVGECNDVEENIDYVGNDVGSALGTLDDCCEKCHSHEECTAYSWSEYMGGTCWLKSGKGETVEKEGVMSSTIVKPPPTCDLEHGVDYVDMDIGNAKASDVGDCCTLCEKFEGCKAFSWNEYEGGTCWFKSGKGETKEDATVISSLVVDDPVCTMEYHVDYVNHDLKNVPGSTPEDCCPVCNDDPECAAFSWSDHEGGTCWLKSGKGNVVLKTGVVSSVVKTIVDPVCNLSEGVDYSGYDIAYVHAEEPGMCCEICANYPGCNVFSWSSYMSGTCWLKSMKGDEVENEDVVSSVVNEVAGPTCSIEENVDYVGNDVDHFMATSAEDCCDMCFNHPDCNAFSWSDYMGGMCWLKSGKGDTAETEGVMSAVVV